MNLQDLLLKSAVWAAEHPMLLDRGGRMWNVVIEYVSLQCSSGIWLMQNPMGRSRTDRVVLPAVDVYAGGVSRIVGHSGNGSPAQVLVLGSIEAEIMWLRLFTAVVTEPQTLATDGSVVRALNVSGGPELDLRPMPLHHQEVWCNLLYNPDLLLRGEEAVLAGNMDQQRRTLLTKSRRKLTRRGLRHQPAADAEEAGRSYAVWSRSVAREEERMELVEQSDDESSDDDCCEIVDAVNPLERSNWPLIRGALATWVYCAYECAQTAAADRAISSNNQDVAALASKLLKAGLPDLFAVAEQSATRRFCWPVPFELIQRRFEQTMCRIHDNPRRSGNDATASELVYRVMTSKKADKCGKDFVAGRLGEALPGDLVVTQLAKDLWSAPELLVRLHARRASRPHDVTRVKCAAAAGIGVARKLLVEYSMPAQERALSLLCPDKDWITVQPSADSNLVNATSPLAWGTTLRNVCPTHREGVDFLVIWDGSRECGPAAVMQRGTWDTLRFGEKAVVLCAQKDWSTETALALANAVTHRPAHALQALKLMLRVPGAAFASDRTDWRTQPAQNVADAVRRIDALLGLFAKDAGTLVDMLWGSLTRGGGDALWTVLSTALCPYSQAVYMAMPPDQTALTVPRWLHKDPDAWQCFFRQVPPDAHSDLWVDAALINRRKFGLTCVPHAVPPSAQNDVEDVMAETTPKRTVFCGNAARLPTSAVSVPGVPVRTDSVGLVTACGKHGVLRAASARDCVVRAGRLHWDLLDAAIGHIRRQEPGADAALRWLRNVMAYPSSPETKNGFIRVPANASGPECEITTGQLAVPRKRFRSDAVRDIDSHLAETPVTLETFARVLPAVLNVYTKRTRVKELARKAASRYLDDAPLSSGGESDWSFSTDSVPIWPSQVVEGPSGKQDVVSRESLVTRAGPWQPNVPRPFSDAMPGMLAGALVNFYWHSGATSLAYKTERDDPS